eukprot:CAMPEP_0172449050 /NCGR_PEP_ID=MMETSP1065-20121228/7872_1 /TAXON_ID=265537 /ORGANISM="Amphiprora paludosa, Strain CCMP125" /LENGTH=291 /DNA_ID=CAMNT_0013200649 /DNA_START=641 /DNA_END=1516 /DNA_ORIENTATION=-
MIASNTAILLFLASSIPNVLVQANDVNNCSGAASAGKITCASSGSGCKVNIDASSTNVAGSITVGNTCDNFSPISTNGNTDCVYTFIDSTGGSIEWSGCNSASCSYDCCDYDAECTIDIDVLDVTGDITIGGDGGDDDDDDDDSNTTTDPTTTTPEAPSTMACKGTTSAEGSVTCGTTSICNFKALDGTSISATGASISSSLINGDGSVTFTGGSGTATFSWSSCSGGRTCEYDCCDNHAKCSFNGVQMESATSGDDDDDDDGNDSMGVLHSSWLYSFMLALAGASLMLAM